MNRTGESSLVNKPDNGVASGTTGDITGHAEQTGVHSEGHIASGATGDITGHIEQTGVHSDMAEKPEEMIAINSSIQQAFMTSQADGGQDKANEMVFTVVAVDGNIAGFNNDSLPKEVQLSIMPRAGGVGSAADTQFPNAQNAGLFNQLALIASTIPASPQEFVAKKTDHPPHHEGEIGLCIAEKDDAKDDEEFFTDKGKKVRVRCSVCNQDFSDLPSMRRHRLVHSDEKPYHCEFCEKSFRRKDNLREHRNIHTQESVYTCTRCLKTFPRKYTHKVHMAKFCTMEKKICVEAAAKNGEDEEESTTEASPAAISKVSRRVSSSNTKCSDPCLICQKTFRDTSTLKRHLLTHSDERPFKCNECNKSFRRKDHLMEHVIVHNEVRPFTCRQCGKSFSRRNGLRTHLIRTSHSPQDQQPLVVNSLKEGTDEEISAEQKTIDVELVASQTFLKNIANNEGDIDNMDSENSAPTTPEKSQHSAVMASPQNSGNFVSEADEIMATETTVVLSEKNPETPQVSRKADFPEIATHHGTGNSGKDDAWMSSSYDDDDMSGDSLRCPNCLNAFPGKEQLWEHFQEHLGDDLFGCEHCFTTFTTPELVKEHQKICAHALNAGDSEDVEVANQEDTDIGDESEEILMIARNARNASGERDETGEEGTSKDPKKVLLKRVSEEDPIGKVLRSCPVCDKHFRDSTALKRHSLVHSGERPHGCNQCDRRFRRRDHLKSHVTAFHLGTTLQCKSCDMVFSTRYCLTTHAKACKKPQPRAQQSTPDKPMKHVHPAEPKLCLICNKTFKDSSSLRRHQRTHSEERPFPCSLCTKSFRRRDNLKEHMLCHSEQKPFSCEDCGKALSRRSSLTNHRTICTMRRIESSMAITQLQYPLVVAERDLSLPENQSIAETQAILEAESLVESQTLPENETLPESQRLPENEMVPESQTLPENETEPEDQSIPKNHSDTYPDATPETIDMCSSGVAREEITLSDINNRDTMEDIQDIGNEEGDKGFSCNLCGKMFRAKWTLKYHQRVHTGEKPYTCLTCNRQFRQPSHLKIHERTHSGERPYACEVCGRAFIDSSTMRRHARVHKDAADPSDDLDDNNDEGNMEEGIEMDVSSLGSAQPMSTAAVPVVTQSDEGNIAQVVGGLSRDNQTQDMVIGKIQCDVNWQGNEQDEQMTYYIVPTAKDGKQDSFENIPF